MPKYINVNAGQSKRFLLCIVLSYFKVILSNVFFFNHLVRQGRNIVTSKIYNI